jgi:hypothetical protein
MLGREDKMYTKLVEKPEDKKLLGIPRYNKRLILKWILEKCDGRVQAGSYGSG